MWELTGVFLDWDHMPGPRTTPQVEHFHQRLEKGRSLLLESCLGSDGLSLLVMVVLCVERCPPAPMGSVCSSGSAAGAAGCDRQLCWYARTDLEKWSFCIGWPYFLLVLLSLENQGVRCHVIQMGPLAEVLRLTVNSGGCSSTQGKDVGLVEVAGKIFRIDVSLGMMISGLEVRESLPAVHLSSFPRVHNFSYPLCIITTTFLPNPHHKWGQIIGSWRLQIWTHPRVWGSGYSYEFRALEVKRNEEIVNYVLQAIGFLHFMHFNGTPKGSGSFALGRCSWLLAPMRFRLEDRTQAASTHTGTVAQENKRYKELEGT